MTGYRSSAAAIAEATAEPELGRRGTGLVDGSRQVGIRLHGREPAVRQLGAHVEHECPGISIAARARGGRDAGDDARWRCDGQLRVQLADVLGSWIRGQRPELGECDRPARSATNRRRGRTSRRCRVLGRATPACAARRSFAARSGPGPGANGFHPGVTNRSSPARTSVADARIDGGVGSTSRSAAASSADRSRDGANGLSALLAGDRGDARRRRCGEPVRTRTAGSPLGVLPVVARPVVEPRVRTRGHRLRMPPRPGHRRSEARASCARSDAEAEALDDRVHVRPDRRSECRVRAEQDHDTVIADREQVDPGLDRQAVAVQARS